MLVFLCIGLVYYPTSIFGRTFTLYVCLFYRMKHIVGEEETTYYFNTTFLHDFFTDFLNHNLKPSLLSENESVVDELNRKSNYGAVENIVGSQFESKVLGNSYENVLVYFHSTW